MNDTIEKAIAAAVETVLDDILDLQEQVENIQRTPGPKGEPGDMPDVVDVGKYLIEHHLEEVRGEKGEPGQDAPDVEQVINRVLQDARFEDAVKQTGITLLERSPIIEHMAAKAADALMDKYGDQLRGQDGKDGKDAPSVEVDIDDVCEALLNSDEFRQMAKGEKGETPSVEVFVEAFHKTHGESLRGADGKDAPQFTLDDVVKAVRADAEFRTLTKGEKGDKGEPGKDANVNAVACVLADEYATLLKGAPGKDADAADVTKLLKADPDFINATRGEKGETPSVEVFVEAFHKTHGESLRGADGKDADPNAVAALLVEKHIDVLRGEKGESGDKGERGEPGEVGSGIQAPSWSKGVYREGVTVQHFAGRYYRAVRDTADEPGHSTDWERMGSGGFRFLGDGGAIDKSTLADGDIYTVCGSTYLWSQGKSFVLASAGEKGAAGKDGEKGISGKDAPFIIAGECTEKSIVFVMSDGSLVDCDTTKLSAFLGEVVKQETANAVEQERKHFESRGVPMNAFLGDWKQSSQYQRGDVVAMSNALWTCKKNVQGRFNPDDWGRVFQMPSPNTVKKVKDLKSQSRIPMNKPPGENLNACVDALLKSELIEYDIQCWNESESFLPILRFASHDPTLLIHAKNVHVISAFSHNQSKLDHLNTPTHFAVLDNVGFLLADGEISAGEKVLSHVAIDKRNPDYDTINIESHYRSENGHMMVYRMLAWVEKEWTVSFIGFGAESDTDSHWRAFHR